MSDNKKYYYLKLKDNFFDREEIKLLERQENGYIYSNLYLKLCLMSLKGEGRLLFRDEIPYDENMISIITGMPIDNIRVGIQALSKLGLIMKVDSGEIFVSDIQGMIGHGSSEAERMAIYRKKLKEIECNNVTEMFEQSTPEKEIKKEKEIDKEALEFTNLFFNDLMRINNLTRYNNKKPNLENWSEHLRLLNKINNVPYGQMIEVWLWAFNHHFWKSNILSTEKFREKYDALKLQMESKQPEPKKQSCFITNAMTGKL